MIPQTSIEEDVLVDLEKVVEPSFTYQLHVEQQRVMGYCDNLDAIRQTIYKILNTERMDYPIYSSDYGVELEELMGEPTSYVIPEIERRITEALMQDDRILEVYDFDFTTKSKNIVAVSFSVGTDLGTIYVEREVEY